jgi:hypothetical protein
MLFVALSASIHNAVLCVCTGSASIHNAVLCARVHQSTMLLRVHETPVHQYNAVLCAPCINPAMLFFALCTGLRASIHNAVLCAQCVNPQCCSLRVRSVSINPVLLRSVASIHNAVLCVLRRPLHQSNAVLFALSASIHNAVLLRCTALRASTPCCSLRSVHQSVTFSAFLRGGSVKSIHKCVLCAPVHQSTMLFFACAASVHQSTMLFFALSASIHNAVLCVHGLQCINPQRCSLRSVHQSTMLFFLRVQVHRAVLFFARVHENSASIHNAVLALSASIHNAVLCVCTELSASIHNAVLCAQCINPQCCSFACARRSVISINAVLCAQCINPQCCSLRVRGLSASIHNAALRSVHQSQCCSLRVHGAPIHQSLTHVLCVCTLVSNPQRFVLALGASIHNAVLCCALATAPPCMGTPPDTLGRTNFRLTGYLRQWRVHASDVWRPLVAFVTITAPSHSTSSLALVPEHAEHFTYVYTLCYYGCFL